MSPCTRRSPLLLWRTRAGIARPTPSPTRSCGAGGAVAPLWTRRVCRGAVQPIPPFAIRTARWHAPRTTARRASAGCHRMHPISPPPSNTLAAQTSVGASPRPIIARLSTRMAMARAMTWPMLRRSTIVRRGTAPTRCASCRRSRRPSTAATWPTRRAARAATRPAATAPASCRCKSIATVATACG